jgi:hypothetical protein
MIDPFRELHRWIITLLSEPRSREELASVFGQVWNEQQLAEDFEVLGFNDEAVDVRRKADGLVGSLDYQDKPRYYFCFIETL